MEYRLIAKTELLQVSI